MLKLDPKKEIPYTLKVDPILAKCLNESELDMLAKSSSDNELPSLANP
jgi:hypothetical protein